LTPAPKLLIPSHRRKLNKLKIKDGFDLSNTIFNIQQLTGAVAWDEPNHLVTRSSARMQVLPTPNDPLFPTQRAISNIGQGGGVSSSDIEARIGWQTHGEKSVNLFSRKPYSGFQMRVTILVG
jgi:hypothetical protein